MSFDEQPRGKSRFWAWAFIIIGLFSMILTISGIAVIEAVSPTEREYSSTVKCGSDSMGLIFGCDNKVTGEYVNEGDGLVLGDIYVYQDDTEPVIHRLVYINNDGSLIMKGDNNYIAEKIDREQIISHVTRIEYK
jgi:hypothetical protein